MSIIIRKIYQANIIIILILIALKEISSSRCGADKLRNKPGILNVTNNNSKRILAKEWTNMKIKVDYTSFKRPSNMNYDTYNKVKKLIEETINEFSKFLKIQHIDITLKGEAKLIKSACEVDSIDPNYANFLKENDLVIFPSFEYQFDEYTLAAARYCLVSTFDSRPCAGNLFINKNLSFEKENTDLYIKHLFLHEITHILIFHPYLLGLLGMAKYDENKQEIYVDSPKVL